MKRIPVRAGERHYDALVGPGLLETSGTRLAGLVRGTGCALVADENTARLFGDKVLGSLRAAQFEPVLVCIPSGENSKSLEQLGEVCEQMVTAGLDRSSFIVALGGGVIGDLAGFAAAIYHRGIPYVQVPTTLLAQVDSSIGGKTGINLTAGKNLLGAVHQPVLVVADTDVLRTLPPREFKQGFAEMIKHAIVADAALFDVLEAFDRERLPELVARNIKIKAAIVARDVHDASGARAILNFGHTVGHAIEKTGGYRDFVHGEAVSLGMVAACEVSVRRAGLPTAERDRIVRTLRTFDLPTQLPPGFPREKILPALSGDKKFERGAVRFVVTSSLGSARLTSEVTLEDLTAAIATL